MSIRILAAAMLALLTANCAAPQQPLPTYHWTDAQTALGVMQARAQEVKTLSAQATLTLTRANGESVRLDGALAVSFPARSVRLRAWKLSHAVFDLTLRPEGLWIETPRQSNLPPINSSQLSASRLARGLWVLGGELFEGARIIDNGGSNFAISKSLEADQVVVADVDRSTLVVRRYELLDNHRVIRFTLEPLEYEMRGSIVWPMRLVATSESGRIDVQLRDIELNQPLASKVFVPPTGAEKAP